MRSIRQNKDMEFDISYTNREITPWGGMIFLKQMLEKTGFRALVDKNTDLPQSGSNRGYKTSTIIEVFGVELTDFYTQKLLAMILLWVKYLIGRTLQDKIHTNVFLVNLHRQKTLKLANIFIHGFLTTSSLIILL